MSKKKWTISLCMLLCLALCVVYCVFNGGIVERTETTSTTAKKIESGGSYTLSGEINGKVKIEAPGANVELILAGVTITNNEGPCIKIEDAASVTITLAEGTENYLYSDETVAEEGTGSAINSLIDFEISGSGKLLVYGYSNNGIKSDSDITISSGSIYVYSVGDGIQAGDELNILGGSITVKAGDDGLHADNNITIENADISITKSVEGIEANHITVNSGNITVVSSDDGFNANGGSNSFGTMGIGMMGRGGNSTDDQSADADDSDELPSLTINGGNIYVIASGDGLDSNGDLIVNGGTVIVDGPSNSANGALDSGSENGGALQVNGGTVLAIGASGMAEMPDSDSACYYISSNLSFSSGSIITISKTDGTVLLSHASQTSGNSIVFASESLSSGDTLLIDIDGVSSSATVGGGTNNNGMGGGGSMWNNQGGGSFSPGQQRGNGDNNQGGGSFGPGQMR